jgi:hypothetical protein
MQRLDMAVEVADPNGGTVVVRRDRERDSHYLVRNL